MQAFSLAVSLRDRYHGNATNPNRAMELSVESLLSPEVRVLPVAGYVRTIPILRRSKVRAESLIGIKLVDFTDIPAGIAAYSADPGSIPLLGASVDMIMFCSMFEHPRDPDAVYRELARTLRPAIASCS